MIVTNPNCNKLIFLGKCDDTNVVYTFQLMF